MGAPRVRRSLAWLLVPVCVLSAQDASAILKQVDRCRYPWPSFSMDVTLKDGKAKQRWRVLVRENDDARVDGLSEKEKRRTVLLLGDQMWLLLPGSKLPIKISPQQRLLGPAAGGDIARFRFFADYTAANQEEEELDGKPCKRLDLQAKRPATSYRTATLWTTREGTPLRCDFYFASGKLARTAQFGPLVEEGGVQVLSSLRLAEPSGRSVDLEFSRWKPVVIESRLFELPKPPVKEALGP